MTPEEFVSCVRCEILEQNLTTYRNILNSSSTSNIRDPYWQRTTELFHSLDENNQQQFIAVMRQVMVDTLSNVFGVLDGTSMLEKHREDFRLTYGEDEQQLNGDLQDYFLSDETK